ncbi:hypothetical protein OXV57_10435 [Bacteroides fragilis]|nr:hypothetical protein [Bacteroides fragilis]
MWSLLLAQRTFRDILSQLSDGDTQSQSGEYGIGFPAPLAEADERMRYIPFFFISYMGNIMLSDGGKATKNLRNDQGNSIGL